MKFLLCFFVATRDKYLTFMINLNIPLHSAIKYIYIIWPSEPYVRYIFNKLAIFNCIYIFVMHKIYVY